MGTQKEFPLRFKPRGVADTVDGDNSAPGACTALTNLIHDPSTPNAFICRPANTQLIDFTTLPTILTAAGDVTAAYQVGNIIYGLVGVTTPGTAYVANYAANTISIIDTVANKLLKTLAVGANPKGVAITPDGAKVYVCNSGAGTVSVISTATNTVTATLATGGTPEQVAFTPDSAKAYVTDNVNSGKVWPITVSTGVIGAPISVSSRPVGVVVTPDGLNAYVGSDGQVDVIQVATDTVISTIPVTIISGEIVIASPDSLKVYVATTGGLVANAISIIDTVTKLQTGVIACGIPANVSVAIGGMAITPDGKNIYVAVDSDNLVDVISTATNAVTTVIPFTQDVLGLAISEDGSQVLVTVQNSISHAGSVVFIPTNTNVPGVSFAVGNTPVNIATGATAASAYAGLDYPFAYDVLTGAFLPVTGITVPKCPTSQATSGAWVPPQMSLTGIDLVVSHVGFDGATHFFGHFNVTTPTAPTWDAGNTATHGLPSVPQAVQQFNNRTYFFCGNIAFYTDTLSLTMTNANQSETLGDYTSITAAAPLPVSTTSQAILQGLLAFKLDKIYLITGDVTSSDLGKNEISDSVGTAAPRSVVPTPDGVKFMASDGIRKINFYGGLEEPDQDLAVPFINAVTPSRVCAVFNADTYRICVQNGAVVGSPYQDFWYNLRRKSWTGPHSFRYDIGVPLVGNFALASNGLPARMWNSYAVQGAAGGSSFIENGTQLTWTYQPAPMTDLENIYANCVVRTTVDIASPASGEVYSFTAQDESGGFLATGSVMAPVNQAVWGAFNWGAANWGAANSGLVPLNIPWNQAVVFNKLVIIGIGPSALGFKISSLHNGYKRLNYLLH